MQPAQDVILIRLPRGEQVRASGIVIPDVSNEKPEQGEVVAAGPGKQVGKRFVATSVKSGDQVLINRHIGQQVEFQGEPLIAMREPDIIAVL